MKKVLAAGVFEVFHAGHLYFLNEARKLGDELTVIVTSDSVARHEGKKPQFSARARAELIDRLRIADRVVVGRTDGDIVKTVRELQPDVIALGYDQAFTIRSLASVLAKIPWRGTIRRVKRFHA
ncbi:MAG: adenylyltransferase/cytidyltransferase family protein [Patescibacteria group bacterium]